jgi:hypothetical protein
MGLLDGYLDPEQFQASGGLLGRLLSLPEMQGLYQPSPDDLDQAPSVPQMPPLRPMPWPTLLGYGQSLSNSQTAASNLTSQYQALRPVLGDHNAMLATVNPALSPDPGNRLSASFQSRAYTPVGNPMAGLASGVAGLGSGPRTDPAGLARQILQPRIDSGSNPQQELNSQYQALRPILGDHSAMLAIVHPEVGRTLIAQALAGQTNSGNTGDADPSGGGQAGLGNETRSIAGGQPPGLSKVGYFEIPTNANQAFGELSDIREREPRDTVSREDHVSGVRDGNVRRNEDRSLDVTNGTVVTFSYKDGRAKTVTVTNNDIAHIDGTTGEVVIQKSPLGDGI